MVWLTDRLIYVSLSVVLVHSCLPSCNLHTHTHTHFIYIYIYIYIKLQINEHPNKALFSSSHAISIFLDVSITHLQIFIWFLSVRPKPEADDRDSTLTAFWEKITLFWFCLPTPFIEETVGLEDVGERSQFGQARWVTDWLSEIKRLPAHIQVRAVYKLHGTYTGTGSRQ